MNGWRWFGTFLLLAGVTALVGGQFVATGSAVAMSALGVLALADAARSAAALADQAMR